MQKILFNELYGMQYAVLNGIKTQTRREEFDCDGPLETKINYKGKLVCYQNGVEKPIHTSRFGVGEIVAVAQSYLSIFNEADDGDYWADIYADYRNAIVEDTKGWKNKMFVKARLMPHRIQIVDVRLERLQDISEEDCFKEGISRAIKEFYFSEISGERCHFFKYKTAKDAFLNLLNLISKKEHRNINPYVIVYEFKLLQ